MAAGRLPIVIVVALAIGPVRAEPPSLAALAAPTEAPPVVLTVPTPRPAETPSWGTPPGSGLNDAHGNSAFFLHAGPEGLIGGCDGDCQPCRPFWVDAAFFLGRGDNLQSIRRDYEYGGRLSAGLWFDDPRSVGLDLGGFAARGSYNAVVAPLAVEAPVSLTTVDANLRLAWLHADSWRIDALVGYRFSRLTEKLDLTIFPLKLSEHVRNDIHAGQLGLAARYSYGSYFTEAIGKVGIGQNSQSITQLGFPEFQSSDLCIVTDVVVRFGYQLGESLWGTFGYQLIHLSDVYRPTLPDSRYFLHGIVLGLIKRF